jgi:hypothetical protein
MRSESRSFEELTERLAIYTNGQNLTNTAIAGEFAFKRSAGYRSSSLCAGAAILVLILLGFIGFRQSKKTS